jgi:hypothetical protein
LNILEAVVEIVVLEHPVCQVIDRLLRIQRDWVPDIVKQSADVGYIEVCTRVTMCMLRDVIA